MKNELIQLAEYLEALEARISDLEQRYEGITPKINALGEALAEVKARLDDEEFEQEDVEEEVVEEETPTVEPEPEVQAAPAKPVGKRVDDLKQAISLGDRFLFQRELFNQSGELMQKTLEELNKQVDFAAAIAYIERKFAAWDKESPTYDLFINILHRRFG